MRLSTSAPPRRRTRTISASTASGSGRCWKTRLAWTRSNSPAANVIAAASIVRTCRRPMRLVPSSRASSRRYRRSTRSDFRASVFTARFAPFARAIRTYPSGSKPCTITSRSIPTALFCREKYASSSSRWPAPTSRTSSPVGDSWNRRSSVRSSSRSSATVRATSPGMSRVRPAYRLHASVRRSGILRRLEL